VVASASGILSQDTIQNRTRYVLQAQHPELARTKALALLLLVIGKLYESGKGNIFRGVIRIAHGQLATHETVRCTRNWTCQSLKRLEVAGLLRVTYLRRSDGKFDPGIYRIGPQLKRIIVALLKLHFPKNKEQKPDNRLRDAGTHRVKSTSQSSPARISKEMFSRLKEMIQEQLNRARGLPAP
jgi:hypothetical protein